LLHKTIFQILIFSHLFFSLVFRIHREFLTNVHLLSIAALTKSISRKVIVLSSLRVRAKDSDVCVI
jgi:hypothetical protein